MAFVSQFLQSITPPPVITPEQYDGLEYRWKALVFRPAELKTELFLLLGVLFYIAWGYIGANVNANRAKQWFSVHLPLYTSQFSRPQSRGGLISDGNSDFFFFSTGRRNVASLHTIFKLRPRHDFVQWLFEVGRSLVDVHWRGATDDVQLDFKLANGVLNDGFVWCVVKKDELGSVKDGRWDLTFSSKTSENAALPSSFIVMTEFADVTETLLTKPLGTSALAKVLSDPAILPYFRSLSITDQPRDRPSSPLSPEEREKHIILDLSLPSSLPVSASGETPLTSLITAVFTLIDNLSKVSLRPDTKTKLRKFREDIDKNIKEEAEKEKREELEEQKAKLKKKLEEERLSKMSAAEQKKELEKERKRNLRKTQGKVVRK